MEKKKDKCMCPQKMEHDKANTFDGEELKSLLFP